MQQQEVDIVLLDINLAGEKSGVWLAQKIREYLALPIVFLTAYGNQRTMKDVILTTPDGYLMKPYQEAELLVAINIAISNFNKKKGVVIPKDNPPLENTIFIKDKSKRIKLRLDEIYYLKSEGNYLDVRLEQKTYSIRAKLSDFQKLLPRSVFRRTHQRYLVNTKKINLESKYSLRVLDVEIPISKKFRNERTPFSYQSNKI